MSALAKLPGTLEQLPRSAFDYYHDSLKSQVFTYDYTGRTDAVGAKVYQRVWRLDGELDGFSALMPYKIFVARVKDAAKRSSSMGIPRFYRPVDPDTGRYWGDTS